MQRRISYVLALLVCSLAFGAAATPDPLAGNPAFVAPAGATAEDEAIRHWQERARDPAALPETFVRLGWAFVAKARATLDDRCYWLVLRAGDALVARHGVNDDERLLRGHALLNLHRFHEAEAVARALVASRQQPRDCALLSDALLELGRIDEAIPLCERFATAQPGLEAYARIAHLRWLKGDLAGAQAAMAAAVRAGSPRDVATQAWALVRLADYELQLGRPELARSNAGAALRLRADYGPALLVQGQALLALGCASEAVESLRSAAKQLPEPSLQWWLAEAWRAAGDSAAAEKVEAVLARQGAIIDPRTYALFLATRGQQPVEALALARLELEVRADPFTHDAIAWAHLAAGDAAAAGVAMQRALAAGTQHPRLFLHAAAIARALGHTAEAQAWLDRAAANPAVLLPSERTRLQAEQAALARPVAD